MENMFEIYKRKEACYVKNNCEELNIVKTPV